MDKTLRSQCRGPRVPSLVGELDVHAATKSLNVTTKRSCMPQLKIPQAATKISRAAMKTRLRQINKYFKKIK